MSQLHLHPVSLKKVKVISGFHKGLSSTEWNKRGKVYEIKTRKGIVVVHKDRCEIEMVE